MNASLWTWFSPLGIDPLTATYYEASSLPPPQSMVKCASHQESSQEVAAFHVWMGMPVFSSTAFHALPQGSAVTPCIAAVIGKQTDLSVDRKGGFGPGKPAPLLYPSSFSPASKSKRPTLSMSENPGACVHHEKETSSCMSVWDSTSSVAKNDFFQCCQFCNR